MATCPACRSLLTDNSVRNDDDFGTGPPEPLCVRSASAGGGAPAGGPGAARAFGGAEVDQVVAGTGCLDRQRIAAALERCGGDVDQAIELLIEQLGQEGEEEPAGGGGGEAPAPQQQQEAADAAAPGSGSGSSSADAAGKPQAAAAAAAIAAPAGQQPSDDAIRLELRLQPGNPGRVALVLHCSGQQGAAAEAAAAEAAAEGGDEGPADSAAGSAAGPAGAAGSKKKKEKKEKGVRLKHKLDHPARNQRCPCGSGKKHKSCCAHRKGGPPAAAAAAEEAAAEAVAQQLRVLDI